MKAILIVIFLLAIILESTLVPFPLTLIFFLAVTNLPVVNIALWAFFTGLVLDLFSIRLLGSTSLLFLSLVFLIERYRKKLDPAGYIFQIFMVIISTLIYFFLFYRSLELVKIIASTIFGGLIILIVRKVTPEGKNKVRLEI